MRGSSPHALVVSLLASLVLLGSSCSRNDPATRLGSPPQVSFETLSLPPPVLARPALRVVFKDPPAPEAERAAARLPGVSVALRVETARVRVRSGEEIESARVLWVDPIAFRSLASPEMRDAEPVWLSLVKGEALVTTRSARRLETAAGSSLRIGGRRVVVGAIAADRSHLHADVVLGRHIARQPSVRTQLLMGVVPSADLADLIGRLHATFEGVRVKRLQGAPVQGVYPPTSDDGGLIPPMAYRILRNGFVAPDPRWIEANIVTEVVPILGEVSCHRIVVPQLRAALAEIEARGLAHVIHTDDYGGCFVPRFIEHNPRRPLSMHAFGLAVDLNVSTNAVGTVGDIDPRVVRAFERWGFSWGGRWSPPDPMHFELTSLIRF